MNSTLTRLAKCTVAAAFLLLLSVPATAQTATVTTDKDDYAPGETVIMTGTGWQPGETVQLLLQENPFTHPDRYLSAVADASGNFTNTEFSPEQHDIGITFTLTATGQSSGFRAQTTFRDANRYWTGCVSSAWTDNGNWRDSAGTACASFSFPVAGDAVVIQQVTIAGRFNPILTVPASALSVTINTGGNLTVQANLTLSDGVTVNGTWNQSGGATTFTSSGKKITIFGTFNHSGGTFGALGGNAPDFLIESTGTASQSGGTINLNIYEVKTGRTFSQSGAASLLALQKDWKNEGTFTSTGGKVQFATGSIWASPNTATNQFFDIEWDAAVTLNAQTIGVRGNWINDALSASSLTGSDTLVVFNGDGNRTIGGALSTTFRRLDISKTSGGSVTLARNTIVNNAMQVLSGTLDHGGPLAATSFNLTANGGISISSGATYRSVGFGDLTLGAGLTNAGTVQMNGDTTACGQSDEVLIRSTTTGAARTWSGTGTFDLQDVNLQDQNRSGVPINVYSGTNAGNNTNFLFVACPVVAVCGNGIVEGAEQCDGTACCTASCTFQAEFTACGSADATACNAPDSCNSTGSCVDRKDAAGSVCQPAGASAACDPVDTCDGTSNTCAPVFAAAGTSCGDSSDTACTDPDSCNGTGSCQVNHAANGSSCADSDLCDGAETCSTGSCVAGTPVNTDDGIACTSDSCDPATGNVTHTANNAACGDGNACNGSETCSATLGCQAGTPVVTDDGNPCTDDSCDPATGAVTHSIDTTNTCSDGNACTQTDSCNSAGACVGSNPVNTDDGNACTDDSCNPATGAVTNTVDTSNTCSDGNACTQTDSCNSTGACVGSNPVTPTSDNNPCTDEMCDPATGNTVSTVDTTNTCSDGNACTQTDSCDSTGACVGSNAVTPTSDNNPCTDEMCDPATGNTVSTVDTTNTCSDGNACTQTDSCNSTGACVGSNPVNTDDGNACTDDSCNPSTGAVTNTVDTTNTCTDGNACTQTDSCNSAGACVGSNPVNTDDGNACTDDSCDPATGAVSNTPDTSNTCSDNDLCTQTDSCNAAGACVGSNPVVCSASDQCHDAGVCDPSSGACSNPAKPDGTSCEDANVCTVSDSCQAGACTAGAANPACAGGVCPGNAPPVVGPVTGPSAAPMAVGSTVTSVSASFTDLNTTDTHSCSIDWDDGQTTAGTISESGGSGTCTGGPHTYSVPGVYTIRVTVTDAPCGATGSNVYQFVVIYDPSGGFVTGGGWINSMPEAYRPDPSLSGRANFGFVARYRKGAHVPEGQTEFQFQVGNVNFHSSAYEWLVISGFKAQYRGSGTINGSGDYGFLLTAYDTNPDRFRIKIWNEGLPGNPVVYDNRFGIAGDDIDTADPQDISGGSIVIHKGGK